MRYTVTTWSRARYFHIVTKNIANYVRLNSNREQAYIIIIVTVQVADLSHENFKSSHEVVT